MMPRLIQSMLDPVSVLDLDAAGWDGLIRVCRRANLLGRLAHELTTRSLIDAAPTGPRAHLMAAGVLCDRQDMAVRLEIEKLQDALRPIGVPLVLLKGAAYLACGSRAGHGRLFSDVDILVPESRLDEVESQLMLAGWHLLPLTPYDERYYRQWMHELPPMAHRTRGHALDVHHNILPRTSRLKANAAELLQAIRPASLPGVFVLSEADQVLHCACHWFFESEHQNGLRDALDLWSLVQEFSAAPNFWPDLLSRARHLGLQVPLQAALWIGNHVLQRDLPVTLPPPQQPWLRWLYRESLRPAHPLARVPGSGLAKGLLYARGHWLRMPAHRLAWHLSRKALMPG